MALEVEQSLEALLGKGIPQVSRSRILNFKIHFDEKSKVFGKPVHKCGKYISIAQVEDALLSRLCPKEHTSLALTCRTALVGYSTY